MNYKIEELISMALIKPIKKYIDNSARISIKRETLAPFIVPLLGSLGDYVTTNIGLMRGFIETHPYYNPFLSIILSWGIVLILLITLPKGKWWYRSILLISSFSFLGFINNSLVLLGLFNGLVI